MRTADKWIAGLAVLLIALGALLVIEIWQFWLKRVDRKCLEKLKGK